MRYKVFLTEAAERDLEDLHDYVVANDSPAAARHLLEGFEKTAASLTEFPERGSWPQELLTLGIKEYRQLMFKSWRIIYRVLNDAVYVYMVADGRRDMQTLLTRRLLGS